MTEAAFFVPDLPPGIPHRRELVVRRSRFIASAGHTPGNEAVRLFIGKCREDFPNARHHCFAFNAGRGDSTAFLGASDDGEPRGTAGRPMLNLLTHSGIGEITVVVSRYFGGTLLGTGGLVKAYGDSTKLVLDGIATEELVEKASFSLTIGYEMYENVKRILTSLNADSIKEDFGTEISISGQIPASEKDSLSSRISDLSNGRRSVVFS